MSWTGKRRGPETYSFQMKETEEGKNFIEARNDIGDGFEIHGSDLILERLIRKRHIIIGAQL